MKKSSMMMAVIGLGTAMAACSEMEMTDNRPVGKNGGISVQLRLNFDNVQSRTVGYPVADQTTIYFENGTVIVLSASDQVMKKVTFSSDGTGADYAVDDFTSGSGVTLDNLSDRSSKVYVVGNSAVTVNEGDHLPDGIGVLTAQSQISSSTINIFGEARLSLKTAGGHTTHGGETQDLYKAEITVAPTVSRFEITDIKAGGHIKSMKVEAIFVDNFYTAHTIYADVCDISTLHAPSNSVANYVAGTAPYNVAGALSDAAGWDITTTATAPAANKVWGHYVFADPYSANFDFTTTAGSAVPRLLIKITNVEIDVNHADFAANANLLTLMKNVYENKTWWVTVGGFDKSGGGQVRSIVSGYVFNIAGGMLTIEESNLHDTPKNHMIAAEIKVTPIKWTLVSVLPKLD